MDNNPQTQLGRKLTPNECAYCDRLFLRMMLNKDFTGKMTPEEILDKAISLSILKTEKYSTEHRL